MILNCELHGGFPHRRQGKGGLSNPLSRQVWSSHRLALCKPVVESRPSLLFPVKEELFRFAKRENFRRIEEEEDQERVFQGFLVFVAACASRVL